MPRETVTASSQNPPPELVRMPTYDAALLATVENETDLNKLIASIRSFLENQIQADKIPYSPDRNYYWRAIQLTLGAIKRLLGEEHMFHSPRGRVGNFLKGIGHPFGLGTEAKIRQQIEKLPPDLRPKAAAAANARLQQWNMKPYDSLSKIAEEKRDF
jgi:hypothetical protein